MKMELDHERDPQDPKEKRMDSNKEIVEVNAKMSVWWRGAPYRTRLNQRRPDNSEVIGWKLRIWSNVMMFGFQPFDRG